MPHRAERKRLRRQRRKWWSSGAGDPRCQVFIVMGKTDPGAAKYSQQSMILVPREASGVKILRPLSLFGYRRTRPTAHGHRSGERARAASNALGEGRGFEIAQGRLVPAASTTACAWSALRRRCAQLMWQGAAWSGSLRQAVAERTVTQERIA